MKTHRKKGFTIVELVIVIAVIAILAAVLIPTFTGVINSAKESKTLQAARNLWTKYTVANAQTFANVKEAYIVIDDTYVYLVKDGQFYAEAPAGEKLPDVDKLTATGTNSGYTVLTGYSEDSGASTVTWPGIYEPTAVASSTGAGSSADESGS